MVKTFIRRPGNKTRFLKHILPLVPKFTGTYYEPFVGTGAVFLALNPEKSILNDLNKDIIEIWKLVKSDPDYIINQITSFHKKFIGLSLNQKKDHCKKIVSELQGYRGKFKTVNYLLMIYCSFNGTITSKEKFYFGSLNGHIYNDDSVHIFTDSYFKKILLLCDILKKTTLKNKDYTEIIKDCKEGDFVFLDPPYIEEKKYSFLYNENNYFDINRLLEKVKILDSKKVKWMMTQIYTPQVKKLFSNYNMKVYTNTTSFNKISKVKHEVIVMNY